MALHAIRAGDHKNRVIKHTQHTFGFGCEVHVPRRIQQGQAQVAVFQPVLVGGKRCPLLACCMDQCFVDVTGVEDAKVGDEITFFGYDSDGNFLSSQETANLIGDDEGCGLTSALMHRVARVFH